MTAFHIFLVIVGLVIVAVSYIISEKITNSKIDTETKGGDSIPIELSQIEKSNIGEQIGSIVSEVSESAVNKTDDKLSQISNEKIMAVSEFSNQILEKIDQNHSEVVFLYNMLNEKEVSLKETVREIDKTKVELEKSVRDYKLNKARQERERMHNHRNSDIVEEKIKEQPEKALEKIQKTSQDNASFKKSLNQANVPNNIENTDELGKNNNEQILLLHEEGKSVIEIARILELGQGEVKLVIDLFQGAKR